MTSDGIPFGARHDIGCRCWPHVPEADFTRVREALEDVSAVFGVFVQMWEGHDRSGGPLEFTWDMYSLAFDALGCAGEALG